MYKKFDFPLLAYSARKNEPEWIKFFNKNKKKLESLDLKIHDLHDKVSAKTNCLECGNCCRTLGPRITDKDVERMGKALRMKPNEVIKQYQTSGATPYFFIVDQEGIRSYSKENTDKEIIHTIKELL